MADTVEATPELAPSQLTDEALDKIFNDPSDADDEPESTPAAETAIPAKPTEAAVTPPPAVAVDTGIDLSLLKDDDKAEATPVPPAIAPEDAYISKIREYIPNEKMLTTLVSGYQRDTALESALAKGDLPAVVTALGPERIEPLFEAIYQNEKLRNAFVDRMIAEHEGQRPDPEVKALRQKVADMESYLNQGRQQQQSAVQREQQMAQYGKLTDTIRGFFETVRFPNDDRHAVQRDLIQEATLAKLAKTGKLAEAMKGDVRVIRDAFKSIAEPWAKAEKAKVTAADAARTTLEQKPKPVATGATGTAAASEEGLDVFQRAANEVARIQRRRK